MADSNVVDDYVEIISPSTKPRKRKRCEAEWAKNIKKNKLNSSEGKRPTVKCSHNDREVCGKQVCRVRDLRPNDIEWFFERIYDNTDKAMQDSFLIKCLRTSEPKRRRRRNHNSTCAARSVVISYTVSIM